MESLGLGWAAEIGRQGFGYVLFMATLVGSSLIIRSLYSELKTCRELSRTESNKVTEALVLAAKAIGESNDAHKETTETGKLIAKVIEGLGERIGKSDELTKSRFDEIIRSLFPPRSGGRNVRG